MEESISLSNDRAQESQSENMTDLERWGSLIGGGALVLMGLKERSLRGALTALVGGSLAYHGAKGQKSFKDTVGQAVDSDKRIRVEKTVTIFNKSPEELYKFWRNLENLPTFMKHLKSVREIDRTSSHWIANAPMDTEVEWDADIVSEQENQLIAWASVEGADIDNSGFVRFQKAPQGRGTEVKVVIEYNPPAGNVGNAIAKLFGESPNQQIGDELRRFKMLVESGEISTTEGQPTCR
jgi:uncharacterized membrane protein